MKQSVDVRNWVSERLVTLSEQEFISSCLHRRPPSSFAQFDYFSIPLPSGLGKGLLASPLEVVEKKNVLILLLHGLGLDCTYPFWHWIRSFTASGFHVLSMDWDGHGAGNLTSLDFQEATRTIPILMDRLYGSEESLGLNQKRTGPKCILAGFSFGANYALLASTRQDIAALCSGVIAVAPAVVIDSSFSVILEGLNYFKLKAFFNDFSNKFSDYGLTGIVPPFGPFRKKSFPMRYKLSISHVEQAKSFCREFFENGRLLRQVKNPVLWIHGVKDRIVPFRKVSPFMMEISSGLYCYHDENRDHLRIVFTDEVPSFCTKFLEKFT